jgi:hypothetical protein
MMRLLAPVLLLCLAQGACASQPEGGLAECARIHTAQKKEANDLYRAGDLGAPEVAELDTFYQDAIRAYYAHDLDTCWRRQDQISTILRAARAKPPDQE